MCNLPCGGYICSTYIDVVRKSQSMETLSLFPRLSLSLPLDFTRTNIMHEKMKEMESLVWNRTHLWPNHGREGNHYGWAWFRTRLFLSFNFFVHNVCVGKV